MTRVHRRALLIANQHFTRDPAGLPDLLGPLNDVHALRDALTDPRTGLFLPHDVTILPELESSELRDHILKACEDVTKHDVLLIYYSGHGLPAPPGDRSLYLCTRDTTLATAATTALPFHDVMEALSHSAAAAAVVVLDCCYSGSATKAAPRLEEPGGYGRFIVTATRGRQVAADARAPGGLSPFTEDFVTGLRGAAARLHSETVTLRDVCDYVQSRARVIGGATPSYSLKGHGDVVMARTPRAAPAESVTGAGPALVAVGAQQPPADRKAQSTAPFEGASSAVVAFGGLPPDSHAYASMGTAPSRGSSPRWARRSGRWLLALLLALVAVVSGVAFMVVGNELLYRLQWPLAESIAHGNPGGETWTPAVLKPGLPFVPLAAMMLVSGALLARVLGRWSLLPVSGFALWGSSGMFGGLRFYSDNSAHLLTVAAVPMLAGWLLPPSARVSGAALRRLVTGMSVTWLVSAWLSYRCGEYVGSSWTTAEALDFANLKRLATADQVLSAWLCGVAGFCLGAVGCAWLLPRVPVPSPVHHSRRWAWRVAWVTTVVVVGASGIVLGARSYLGRLDREFTDPGMRALALPWFDAMDGCTSWGNDCTLRPFLDLTARSQRLYFLPMASPTEARDWVLHPGASEPDVADQQGTENGYTYFISVYDGHDGTIRWTHKRCSCAAVILVHNDRPMFSHLVSTFGRATRISVKAPD